MYNLNNKQSCILGAICALDRSLEFVSNVSDIRDIMDIRDKLARIVYFEVGKDIVNAKLEEIANE